LWAGLPVVTWRGEAFVSRGSSGLLYNLGLSELCADTVEQYEKTAVELSLKPEKLKVIKDKLKAAISTSPIFNTQLYVKNLERAYLEVWKNYLSAAGPRDIKID
jgi:predicted O-linked N-acetylglucosamine transferase (SPINDLY family)